MTASESVKSSSSNNGIRRFLAGLGISICTVLIIQTGALIYWAGAMTVRMQYLEKGQQSIINDQRMTIDHQIRTIERLNSLEAKLK